MDILSGGEVRGDEIKRKRNRCLQVPMELNVVLVTFPLCRRRQQ